MVIMEVPTADTRTVRRWPSFLVGLGVGIAAAVAATTLWPTPQYGTWESAEAMADAIGCTDTFVADFDSDGTSGHCEVLGARVLLAAFTSPEAHGAWTDGVTAAYPHVGRTVSVSGEGYFAIALDDNPDIMRVIGEPLSR